MTKTDAIKMNFQVGNDNGNSEHDIIINGRIITQPNVFGRTKKYEAQEDMNIKQLFNDDPDKVDSQINSNLVVSINSPSCEPGIYYIGKFALASGILVHNLGLGLENDKTNSDVPVINTLAQIAAEAVRESYKNNTLDKPIVVNVDMTTELPITQFNKVNEKKFSERFLISKHSVIVHVGRIPVSVDIFFDYVKVLPEGVPPIHYLKTLPEGHALVHEFNERYGLNVDGKYFDKKKILHNSIGDGTTEIPLTEDIIFNPHFITGVENGAGYAIEKALPEFKKSAHLRTFTRQDFSKAVQDTNSKHHLNALEHLEDPLEVEAEQISRATRGEAERAKNDIDILAVYGGGSILMKNKLEPIYEKFCEETDIKLLYMPKEYSVIIEALGLYEFTKGSIFKKLKNDYLKPAKSEVAATK